MSDFLCFADTVMFWHVMADHCVLVVMCCGVYCVLSL